MIRHMSCALCAVGIFVTSAASSQTIFPIDRAAILAGSTFDMKVEFPGIVPAANARVTINGQDHALVLGRPAQHVEVEDGTSATSLWLKGIKITTPGRYAVTATDGTKSSTVTWDVYNTPTPRRAKNVILFVGDGMSVAHVTAARILSREIKEGKPLEPLTIDTFPSTSMVGTAGSDSVVTDSANSAHAYTTGHKTASGALGVYAGRAKNDLDHPKVETIAELVKRQLGMAVGVVTNTEIADATPASMVAHIRRRWADYEFIVDQFLNLKPDVLMGGGSAYFIPKSVHGSKRKDEQDYLKKFQDAGYQLVTTRSEMVAAGSNNSTGPLLGLFTLRNMDGALDRHFLKAGTVSQFPEQPDLTEQTRVAIDLLQRNSNGFFLMVESGLIDKASHPLDWERAVYDTIMLDNAVKVAVDWAAPRDDTLIIVVPDHAHGIALVGTVDDNRPGTGREKVGVYEEAGFPNYPRPNADRYPPSVDVSKRLAMFFAAFPDYYETFKPKLDGMNVPSVMNADQTTYGANQKYKDVPGAMFREGNVPKNVDLGIHAGDDVVLRAWGPGSELFRGYMDNTDVFRIMATALRLASPN